VVETAWPYPSKWEGGAGSKLKHLVAKTSMAISRTLPGRMGNRFLYLGQKN
jgi:hypothetical protein